MTHTISGSFSSGDGSSMWSDDTQRLYIIADSQKNGRRGRIAHLAVIEAFREIGKLPESIQKKDFEEAVMKAIKLSQQIIERDIRSHIRSGALDGVVEERLNQKDKGEHLSSAEEQRNEGLAIEEVTKTQLEAVGSTALVALERGGILYVANVAGDSRLEVIKKKEQGYVVEAITLDHGFLWLRMQGKLPPGNLDKAETFALQKKLDNAKEENELEDKAILKEAWKMKEMKGQELSVKDTPNPDFYEVALSEVCAWDLYTHDIIEHTQGFERKKEIIDAEKIRVPSGKICEIVVGLAGLPAEANGGMIHVRSS